MNLRATHSITLTLGRGKVREGRGSVSHVNELEALSAILVDLRATHSFILTYWKREREREGGRGVSHGNELEADGSLCIASGATHSLTHSGSYTLTHTKF